MLTFAQSLDAVRKDGPSPGDVHVAGTSYAPQPKKKKPGMPFTMTAKIAKLDEDQHLVYGWASVITEGGEHVIDSQGDMIEVAELQKAAHSFMAEQRNAGKLHSEWGPDIGTIVESLVLTEDVQKALGIDLGKVGWFICAKIADDEVWAKIKSGEYSAFSIGGTGSREII